jgi:type IV pilus assembly protein PilC
MPKLQIKMNSIDVRFIRNKGKSPGSPEIPAAGDAGIWKYLNRDISFRSGLPDKIKENIYLELGALLEAGVNIRSSLELIRDNQSKARNKLVLESILNKLTAGASLAESLEYTGLFTAYEYFSIRIGEDTGKLNHILKELALYFQKKIKQRRQIIGALTYPGIVLSVAFIAIIFMVSYVVPMFSDVFKRFGGDLPYPTKLVLYFSKIVREYFFIFLLVIVAAILLIRSKRKSEPFRHISSSIILKTPVIRSLVSKIYLSRFANTMSLLISSRIPILQGLAMCRKIIGFYPIEKSLVLVENRVMEGISLHEALNQHSIYPKKMISMIKVGEDVNQLELFFAKIAEQYSEEAEYQTSLLSKAMEPLIIILLGLVVGAILIAMYLPLFKMGQGF